MTRIQKWNSAGLLALALVVGGMTLGCGQELKQENEKLKADIAAMSQENSKLSEESTSLKTENGNLSSQVSQLQTQAEALNKQISDMKAKKTAPRR